ncbi:hypothetical protein KAR91_39365 [Candidatus Pacearchaeota archaeon]|nr:hypothetical protein [Candidatus Pacearchaeota archaeon]
MRKFEIEISKPIIPRTEELMYIPPQVIVEYLFYQSKLEIDAIIFSSSRTSGKNIAIKIIMTT